MTNTAHAAGELVDSRGRKYLTADERTRFLGAVRSHPKPSTRTLALTLTMTGCRVSEALGLRACDVDLDAAELRIEDPTLLRHVSPLGWEHIVLTGDYDWNSGAAERTNARPLNLYPTRLRA